MSRINVKTAVYMHIFPVDNDSICLYFVNVHLKSILNALLKNGNFGTLCKDWHQHFATNYGSSQEEKQLISALP